MREFIIGIIVYVGSHVRVKHGRRDPTRNKARKRGDKDLNPHPPTERATSQGFRAAGSKARAAAAVGWSWRKDTRERTLQSTEPRMLEVA
jgi:hypothetical protein